MIKLYGHNRCKQVRSVITTLNLHKADFEYINVDKDRDAQALVMKINQGMLSVPTLVFPDGTTLTEPTPVELSEYLRAQRAQKN